MLVTTPATIESIRIGLFSDRHDDKLTSTAWAQYLFEFHFAVVGIHGIIVACLLAQAKSAPATPTNELS